MSINGFTIYNDESDLATADLNLIEQARVASASSYSPYSNYMVGSALLLDNGLTITGSNQENASYPAGLCAERVAVFHSSSQYPDARIEAIAVVAKRSNETHFRPVAPCGICRQVLLEYELKQKRPLRVILQDHEGKWVVASSAKLLLPYSFGHDSL